MMLVVIAHACPPPIASAAPAPVPVPVPHRSPSEPAWQAGESPHPNPNREGNVFDTVGILTARQEESIQNDLNRASWLGVEILVYTRMAKATAEQSQEFADQLLVQWNVQSEAGADDGLVYLITVNPAEPETNSIVIAAGDNALPIRQLDRGRLREILQTEMQPAVDDGEFNTAIQYGVRRVLNYREYTPENVARLTARQETLSSAATIMGVMLVQLAVFGYFLLPIVRERRITLNPSTRSLSIYAVVIGGTSILTGLVAIVGRQGTVSLVALGLLLVASCLLPLIVGYRNRRSGPERTVRVRQRVRSGSRHAIGRAHG